MAVPVFGAVKILASQTFKKKMWGIFLKRERFFDRAEAWDDLSNVNSSLCDRYFGPYTEMSWIKLLFLILRYWCCGKKWWWPWGTVTWVIKSTNDLETEIERCSLRWETSNYWTRALGKTSENQDAGNRIYIATIFTIFEKKIYL